MSQPSDTPITDREQFDATQVSEEGGPFMAVDVETARNLERVAKQLADALNDISPMYRFRLKQKVAALTAWEKLKGEV